MEPIVINDINIINFYKENPQLDIVSMNHIFIDILKKLSTNLSNSLDNAVNSQILSIVKDIKGELYKVNSDIILKLHENKKEYISDIKTLLQNNELSNQEKIGYLFDKNNESLFTKTTLLLNECIPKSQEKTYYQIENCIKACINTISEDTNKILKQTGNNKTDDIIGCIEKNFNTMVTSIQQPLFNIVQASENRTNKNIQQINDSILIQKQVQESLTNELNVFLNKYKSNSSVKGAVSETELYSILQSIVPQDEITRCSNETASGDIKINRRNKKLPTILFENKDYSASVNKEEIEKFQRDLKIQKCHGILISQNSPITYKDNFHIDIINNLIHLYIPNAKYDPEKIKIGIKIIDSLSDKLNLSYYREDDVIKLNLDEVEEIKEEYRKFANKKTDILDTIKLITKQLIEKMEEIQLPNIKKFGIGDIENKHIGILCTSCNKFTAKNKASLSAHMKGCKVILNNKNIVVNTSAGTPK